MNYFVHQIFYLKSIQHPRLYCFIKRATSPIEVRMIYKPEGKLLTSSLSLAFGHERICIPKLLETNRLIKILLKRKGDLTVLYQKRNKSNNLKKVFKLLQGIKIGYVWDNFRKTLNALLQINVPNTPSVF
jgi:hypothetical protein